MTPNHHENPGGSRDGRDRDRRSRSPDNSHNDETRFRERRHSRSDSRDESRDEGNNDQRRDDNYEGHERNPDHNQGQPAQPSVPGQPCRIVHHGNQLRQERHATMHASLDRFMDQYGVYRSAQRQAFHTVLCADLDIFLDEKGDDAAFTCELRADLGVSIEFNQDRLGGFQHEMLVRNDVRPEVNCETM